MKRDKMIKGIALISAICLLMAMLTACGTAKAPAEAPAETPAETPDTTSNSTKVAIIVPGNRGDNSINDLCFNSVVLAEKELGITYSAVEVGGDPAKQEPALIELSENPDNSIILCSTATLRENSEKVAAQYPDKKYIMFDTQVDFAKTGLKNAYSQSYKDNESSFLAGVAAAKFTTSGYGSTNDKKIIGFVAGVEIPIINDFLVGYIEGAKYADPEVKVLISYIGSFHDSAKGKEMALAQYQQGADVIFQVAGGSGLGVLNAAQESGKYAIGVDIDQYHLYKTSNPAMANQIITSAVKKVDVAVAAAIKRAINNELPWGTHEFLGIAEGANGIAKNENYEKCLSQEARDFIDATEKKVLSGEIKIKSAYGMPQEELNSLRDSVKP